jgi:hypothetical protein
MYRWIGEWMDNGWIVDGWVIDVWNDGWMYTWIGG